MYETKEKWVGGFTQELGAVNRRGNVSAFLAAGHDGESWIWDGARMGVPVVWGPRSPGHVQRLKRAKGKQRFFSRHGEDID